MLLNAVKEIQEKAQKTRDCASCLCESDEEAQLLFKFLKQTRGKERDESLDNLLITVFSGDVVPLPISVLGLMRSTNVQCSDSKIWLATTNIRSTP